MSESSLHELACSHRWRERLLAQTKAQCLNNVVLGLSNFVRVKGVNLQLL